MAYSGGITTTEIAMITENNDTAMITLAGFMNIQVCVPKDMSDDDAISFAESKYPCGTTNGWMVSTRVDQRVQCEERAGCCHILLDA